MAMTIESSKIRASRHILINKFKIPIRGKKMRRVAFLFCLFIFTFFCAEFSAHASQNIVANYSGTAEVSSPYGFSSTAVQIAVTSQNGRLFQGTASFMGNTFYVYGMLVGQKILAASSYAAIDGFMNESFTSFTFTIRCADPSLPYVATGTMTKY